MLKKGRKYTFISDFKVELSCWTKVLKKGTEILVLEQGKTEKKDVTFSVLNGEFVGEEFTIDPDFDYPVARYKKEKFRAEDFAKTIRRILIPYSFIKLIPYDDVYGKKMIGDNFKEGSFYIEVFPKGYFSIFPFKTEWKIFLIEHFEYYFGITPTIISVKGIGEEEIYELILK